MFGGEYFSLFNICLFDFNFFKYFKLCFATQFSISMFITGVITCQQKYCNKENIEIMSNPNKKTDSTPKEIPLADKVYYTLMIADNMRTKIIYFST